MTKSQIIYHPESIIENFVLTKEQSTSILHVLEVVKKNELSTKEDKIRLIEILLKLLSIGSNFFDKWM